MPVQTSFEIHESQQDQMCRTIFEVLPARPLAALDQAIDALERSLPERDTKYQGKLLNLFARACLSFSDAHVGIQAANPLDQLFSPAASSVTRRNIAVALARLRTVCPDVVARPNMSQRMITLYDDCFADSLYR